MTQNFAQPSKSTYQPLVSVITPSFNHAEFIEDTISSVKNQTYPYVEHIIVDGGSTDGTVNILRRFQAKYNMVWLSEPDRGQADAINKGFGLASGDILCWLNSDDIYLANDVLAKVVALFNSHPEAQIISGGAAFLDKHGQFLQPFYVAPQLVNYPFTQYAATIIQPATFFGRDIWARLELDISLHFAFDWDFFVRLSQNGKVLPVQELWAGYRLSGANKTFTGGATRVKEMREVTRRYLGHVSWQYQLMTIYYVAFALSEKLPAQLCQQVQQSIVIISQILNRRTGHRVANIL